MISQDKNEDVCVDLSPKDKILVHLSQFHKKVKPGDHLAVPIFDTPSTHRPWHHGIYVGEENGEAMVIHMHGENKSSATICQDSLIDFCGDATHVAIVQYSDDSGREQALWNAQSLLQSNAGELYNLLNNNCEHFAVYCWTGRCVVSISSINTELTAQYNKISVHKYDKFRFFFS